MSCTAESQSLSPKRQAILGAASRLFTAQGYGAVSMEAVAKEAGVSKATLYAHFTGKDALFAEMVAQRVVDVHPLQALATHDRSPRETLRAAGRTWLSFMLAPQALAIFRIVVAEGPRFPDLARAFHEAGPRRGLEWAAAWVAEEIRLGRLRSDTDPRIAGAQLMGLLRGEHYMLAVLGLEAPDEAAIAAVADAAAETFLRAYAR